MAWGANRRGGGNIVSNQISWGLHPRLSGGIVPRLTKAQSSKLTRRVNKVTNVAQSRGMHFGIYTTFAGGGHSE